MKIPAIGRVVLAAALAGALAGCEAEVAHGLTEKDANEIEVALSKNGIHSEKKPDPSGGDKGGWMVSVPKGEGSRATEILVTNHLPPDHPMGWEDIAKNTPMVPSATDDKAKVLAALQGGLERSLESIDGVLSARVNINQPDQVDLEDRNKRPMSTASVIVTYARAKAADGTLQEKPPITEDKVKSLVAHAVQDLQPQNVDVALTPANLPGGDASSEAYVDIAGLRMSTDSVTTFKTYAALGIVAILGLATWVGMLYFRSGQPAPRSRARAAPEA